MAKIRKVTAATRAAILRKSAYALPNNPSDAGFGADDIRGALFRPLTDERDSALAELDRVAAETSDILALTASETDTVFGQSGNYLHGVSGFIYEEGAAGLTVTGFTGTVPGKSRGDGTRARKERISAGSRPYSGGRGTASARTGIVFRARSPGGRGGRGRAFGGRMRLPFPPGLADLPGRTGASRAFPPDFAGRNGPACAERRRDGRLSCRKRGVLPRKSPRGRDGSAL